MGAIFIDPATGRAGIALDDCVECYACYRGMSTEELSPRLVRGLRRAFGLVRLRFDPEPDVCPTSAIVPDELIWPRTVRRVFSDVGASHEDTGIQGRGTEEVKTNDVTGRIEAGDVGFVVELGRPAIGARFRDIDLATRCLAGAGARFERDNPVTALMVDTDIGAIDPEVLEEKVLSAIIEFNVRLDQVPDILERLEKLAGDIDTVMAVGAATRCDAEGGDRLKGILEDAGQPVIRAKTNLGFGHVAAGATAERECRSPRAR